MADHDPDTNRHNQMGIEIEVESPLARGTWQRAVVLPPDQVAWFGRHTALAHLVLKEGEAFFPLDAASPDARIHGQWGLVGFDLTRRQWTVANTGTVRPISVNGALLPPHSGRHPVSQSLGPGTWMLEFVLEDRSYRVRITVPGTAPAVAATPIGGTGTRAGPVLGMTEASADALAVSVATYGARRFLEGESHPVPLTDKQIHGLLREVDHKQDLVRDGAARVQKAFDLARRRYVEANKLDPYEYTGPNGRHAYYVALDRAGLLAQLLKLYELHFPERLPPTEHWAQTP